MKEFVIDTIEKVEQKRELIDSLIGINSAMNALNKKTQKQSKKPN